MNSNAAPCSYKKIILVIAIIVSLIAIVELYFGVWQHNEMTKNIKIDGVYLSQAKEIEDFHLTDNHHQPFTKTNLHGHWTLLFFGFTNCGMVCPTTMAALADMYRSLSKELPADKLPQVVLVSVDPERDTVKRMQEYVASFHPNFMGVRGGMNETLALEKQLHIAAVKMQADGQDKTQYTINHGAEILLFNPKGQLQAYLSYPHEALQMAKDYKLIIQQH